MNKQFLPYKLALKLKELGFNEICLTFYNHNGRIENNDNWCFGVNYDDKRERNECLAPLWQEAFEWFRDKYNLHLEVTLIRDNVYSYEIYNNDDKWVGYKEVGYHTAKQKGLEKLIEIIKRIA